MLAAPTMGVIDETAGAPPEGSTFPAARLRGPACHTPPKHERDAHGRSDGPASLGADALPGVPSPATHGQNPPARPVPRVAGDPRGKTGIPTWKPANVAARVDGDARSLQRDAPREVPGTSVSLSSAVLSRPGAWRGAAGRAGGPPAGGKAERPTAAERSPRDRRGKRKA